MEALYTAEQLKQFEAVGEAVGSEEIAAVQQEWSALLEEIRANVDLDPSSASAQALGARADALKERTLRGYRPHPELIEAIRANYQRGAFEGEQGALHAADQAFLDRVTAARRAADDASTERAP